MRLGGSIQLARVFGVRVGVDPSWFVVLFLIIWSFSDSYGRLFPGHGNQAFSLAVVSALLFFLSVLLHELGHAVVARRNGIEIAGIDLWLFGGLAKMKTDANSAGVEFRIAIAGPIVTLALAVLCVIVGDLIEGPQEFRNAVVLSPSPGSTPAVAVLGYMALVNGALFCFNLLPGFPLDGGRIVRALAWWRVGNRERATRFAARMGRGCAYLLIGVGIYWALTGDLISGVWLVFLGVFLARAARMAEVQANVQTHIAGRRVSDLMDPEVIAIPDKTPLDQTLDEFFWRYGWSWFPVIDSTGRLVGLLEREQAENSPASERHLQTAGHAVSTNMQASLWIGVDEPLEALFSTDALQRLGAVMAVDKDGVLQGIVTLDKIQKTFRAVAPRG
jgi:Zn-dependent protease